VEQNRKAAAMKEDGNEEYTLIPGDEVERASQAEREEFIAPCDAPAPQKSAELAPLVEVFRAQLLPCLEECAAGRNGLFVESATDDWPLAARLRELAFALQQIFAQSGGRCALADEFLDLCTIHGEHNPGEQRLARQFLERIENGQVGSAAEPPPPWIKPEDKK
jgi:AcrR family transcriptional regulator